VEKEEIEEMKRGFFTGVQKKKRHNGTGLLCGGANGVLCFHFDIFVFLKEFIVR